MIQSTHDPEHVCERVEAFVQDMHDYLATKLTDEVGGSSTQTRLGCAANR